MTVATAPLKKTALEAHPYKKADVQVYSTTDYSIFHIAPGNRIVNSTHLGQLIESMKKNYLFTVILVNEDFEIIDGQHRLAACKALKLPVLFTIQKGYGLKEIQILNINSRNWNLDDYLAGFIKLGKQDYIDFKRFKNKYKFGNRENIMLLGDHTKEQHSLERTFKQGKFKVQDYSAAVRIADKLVQFGDVFEYYKNRGFITIVTMLIRTHEKFNIDELLHKCKENPSLLYKCATTEQYLDMIEKIYNYRRREKVALKYA